MKPLVAAAVFSTFVIAAWFSPKLYRPWCRAALLVGCTFGAPRSSLFVWLVWTTAFVVTAALILTCRKPDAYRE